jgi:hypothetical protein
MPKLSRRHAPLSAEAIADRAFAASGHLMSRGSSAVEPSEPIASLEDATLLMAQAQTEIDTLAPVKEAFQAVLAHARAVQQTRNKRELAIFETDTKRIALLVRFLLNGSYQDQAARAGRDPRFWAADMTFLERRAPDRWGRRQNDESVPRVVVQIGVKDSDVQVGIVAAAPPTSTNLEEPIPASTTLHSDM